MTTAEIAARIITRADDDPNNPGSVRQSGEPIAPEVLSAINEGQELFCWMTLCLETTVSFTITGSTAFSTFSLPDFLCPLRLMVSGARVRPSGLGDLDASDTGWQARVGTPARYLTLGFKMYAISPQPALDTAASFTYARAPLQLVADSFPEIPEQYHQSLVQYGIYRIKLKEGAQGLQRGSASLNAFLDAATEHGNFVRARARNMHYDTMPFELQLFDRSSLFPKAA